MNKLVCGLFIPFGAQRSTPNAITYNIISNNQRSASLPPSYQPVYRVGRAGPSLLRRRLTRFGMPGAPVYFQDCNILDGNLLAGFPYYGLYAENNFDLRTVPNVPIVAGAQTLNQVYVATGFI